MDLSASMKAALAETWVWGFKSHVFHWNVRGPMFSQYHEFFGDIYADADGAVDALAEQIRALDDLAPSSIDEITGPARIIFSHADDAEQMLEQLSSDNKTVIDALAAAQTAAEDAGKKGLANFLQDRLDKHAKWGWMLTAYTKKDDAPPRRMRSLYRARD